MAGAALAGQVLVEVVLDLDLVQTARFQVAQVDDVEFLLENVGEAALGQAAHQGHLAAFEAAAVAVAGAGLLAVAAAAGVDAVARAGAAAHPLAVPDRALGWL